MSNTHLLAGALASLLLLNACSDDSNPTDSEITVTDSTLDTSHFRSIVSATTAECTLDNGTTTTCHQLTFNVNEIRDGSGDATALVDDEAGPFCPSGYESTDGGVGIYDGTTGAGFQNLTKTLWDSMEADGFDVIDESNSTICIQDPGAGTSTGNNCDSYCLNAAADDNLTVTYLIPVTPELLSTPSDIGTVEPVGVSLDGVPITGAPPSVVSGPPGQNVAGGNIPSLDHCGGHHDPAGYYHWHLIPESADAVHVAHGTDDQADCGVTITQNTTALTGYARDGFPIYAYQDMVSGTETTPSDLDSCNGHTSVTTEFPEGVYHYHASLEAPNMPPCTVGASVEQRSSPVFN